MTKKHFILIAVVPLIVIVAVGVLAMLSPGPSVTKANFDRIESGMTREQVEEIFGRQGVFEGELIEKGLWGDARSWKTHNGSAHVYFVNNCVFDTTWVSFDETLPEKIRRWLHLR